MSRRAWFYIWIVLLIAMWIVGINLPISTLSLYQWLTFLALVLLASAAELCEVIVGRQSYFPRMAIFFSSLLLVPPPLFVNVVLISHLIEWLKKRLADSDFLRNWYLQPFNIATHIIAGTATFSLLALIDGETKLHFTPENILLIFGAALIYVLINHLLVGQALVLARGISWQQSRILSPGLLSMEVVVLLLGYVVALIWWHSLWLVPFAATVIFLIYQKLLTPRFQKYA